MVALTQAAAEKANGGVVLPGAVAGGASDGRGDAQGFVTTAEQDRAAARRSRDDAEAGAEPAAEAEQAAAVDPVWLAIGQAGDAAFPVSSLWGSMTTTEAQAVAARREAMETWLNNLVPAAPKR